MSTNISSMNKRDEIIEYVRKEAEKKRYPTYDYIENKFKISVRTYFPGGIKEIYKLAKVPYLRDPNPFLKYKKEKILTDICIKILKKIGYRILSISIKSSKHGPDLIIQDEKQNIIPVEIKAYQKYGKIGWSHAYFDNEIVQLTGYIKRLDSHKGLLFTSTDRKTIKNIPKNITIFFGKDIKKFLIKYNFVKELEQLEWIKSSHVSIDKTNQINKIREQIIRFVGLQLKDGKYVGKREMLKKLGVNVYTYFNAIADIYKNFNIDVSTLPKARMGGNIDKEIMRNRILAFFKKEVEKGRYPTYKEIQRTFSCSPILFFHGGIREIYSLLELGYDRKFAVKTKEEKEMIKQEIIEFIKECYKNNFKPTYRDIKNKFRIGIDNYFEGGIQEIYEGAVIEIGTRKGLRK